MPQVRVGDRGALELFVADDGLVVRVRVARVQRIRGRANVGLAIDDTEEAARLARRLTALTVASIDGRAAQVADRVVGGQGDSEDQAVAR